MAGTIVSTEAKSSSPRSWVVDMGKLLHDTDAGAEKNNWKRQCIYRVPEWLKKATDRGAYSPELVSLGPFHHGRRDLSPMEDHKRRAMLHLVKRSGKPLQEFVDAVGKVAEQLMGAYKDLRLQKPWRGAENIKQRFVEVMVVDGCFFLEVMRLKENEGIFPKVRGEKDYASNDPVFSKHGFLYVWPRIYQDIILIENQLPLLLIETILAVLPPNKCQNTRDINRSVLDLLDRPAKIHIKQQGLHPLGILHSSFTYNPSTFESTEDHTYACDDEITPEEDEWTDDNGSCAEKMREAGIHLRKSGTDSFLDVHYEEASGVLSMPCLEFYGSKSVMLLNLMAFERLHTAARNDVTAYVYFMDDIIDTAKDVELLRSKEIVKHEMGSDKELADLFNETLNRCLVMGESSRLPRVRRLVYAHCKKPWNRWRAELRHTYFSNPWKIISLVAAVILLVATLWQTACTVGHC